MEKYLFMSKTVLVTGSSGFIGPHIVEKCLDQGWLVKCVDLISPEREVSHRNKKNIIFLKKDVRDLDLSDLKGVDYIAHMAFVTNIPNSVLKPIETTKDNIDMTAILLKKATEAKIKKVIFPSTASLYGNNQIPWIEDMKADPIEPYSWQKLSCEYLCKMWTIRYSLPTTVLRLFQVFGENPRKDSALYAFINAKKNKTPITLTETTAQSAFKTGRRDFIYVKDVASAFVSAMVSEKTGNGETLNIGTGEMTTMENIAKAIGGEIKFIPKRSFEVDAHQANMEKCYKYLDWKHTVEVKSWLKEYCKI